jgi:hypothetical protein
MEFKISIYVVRILLKNDNTTILKTLMYFFSKITIIYEGIRQFKTFCFVINDKLVIIFKLKLLYVQLKLIYLLDFYELMMFFQDFEQS